LNNACRYQGAQLVAGAGSGAAGAAWPAGQHQGHPPEIARQSMCEGEK